MFISYHELQTALWTQKVVVIMCYLLEIGDCKNIRIISTTKAYKI